MKIRNRDPSRLAKQAVAWIVAGSDSSAGAGIQADNQVCRSFDVMARNIVTALTAQNSHGVREIQESTIEFFQQQFAVLREEEKPGVIKLGMLASDKLVEPLVAILGELNVPVVCDPVMTASAGGQLIDDFNSYNKLLEKVSILTPNQEEFFALAGQVADTPETLQTLAIKFSEKHQLDLVITGGDSHFKKDLCSDLCVIDGKTFWMHSPRVASQHVHGTGCSFSTAIAASLAMGYACEEAVVLAKTYLNQGFACTEQGEIAMPAFRHTCFPGKLNCLPVISSSPDDACQYTFPRIDTHHLGVYPVVDSLEWIQRCLDEGIKTLQLRIKHSEYDELDNTIKQAVILGRQYNARLFINDYWQLAIKHKAYGVHLGQEDLDTADLAKIAAAGLHLGVSTHSWLELSRAHSIQPSYIAIGPIFHTLTKEMPFAPQGLDQLQEWLGLIRDQYPVVAIGGIDLNNASDVLACGVGSIAVVRAVTEAADYRQAIRRLQALFQE